MKELNQTSEKVKIVGRRFIRLGENIYISNSVWQFHSHMAKKRGVKLEEGRLFVDDGGFFRIVEGKLAFSGDTTTADIKGERTKAREETIEIAKNILGEDKVFKP